MMEKVVGSVFVQMIGNDNERRNEHKSNEFVPNIGDPSSIPSAQDFFPELKFQELLW